MYKVRSSFRFVTSAILADLSVSSFRRLLARYRFSSIFFFFPSSPPPPSYTYPPIRVRSVIPSNNSNGVLDHQQRLSSMLNLRLARHCFLLSSSLSPPPSSPPPPPPSIHLPFSSPFDCLQNVTSRDRPSSLAVCSQLQRGPGLPPFSKFLVPKKRLDNEQFDSDCPEFRFVSRPLAHGNH